jgi:hypothetical protein
MNYEKNYYDYIMYVKTLERKKNNGVYYEEHHIIPKSIGGNNKKENKVLLTAREHYLAHYLLWKFTDTKEMMYAFWCLNNMSRRKIYLNSRLYEKLKQEIIKYQKENFCGSNNIFYGRKHTEETKQKISKSKKENPYIMSEEEKNRRKIFYKGENNPNYGRKHTDEEKLKMSIASKGRDNGWKGRKHTDETKQKMKERWDDTHLQSLEKIRVKVINLDTQEIFESISAAAKKYKVNTSTISKICKKKYGFKTARGFHFSYYTGDDVNGV